MSNSEKKASTTDTEKVAKALDLILRKNRERLVAFLEVNGSKETLVAAMRKIEEMYPKEPCVLQHLLKNTDESNRGAVFELPTNELCLTLRNLFRFFGITRLLEVGAGSGILTARLLSYLDPGVQIEATDINADIDDPQRRDHVDRMITRFEDCCRIQYTRVRPLGFHEINEKNTPVLISWLCADYEGDFFNMVKQNMPSHVFLVGEDVPGSCQTPQFMADMAALGYDHCLLTPKQLSQLDYFVRDRIRQPSDSRSLLSLFSLKPMPTVEKLAEVCGPENLGTTTGLPPSYVMQDLSMMLLSRKADSDCSIM